MPTGVLLAAERTITYAGTITPTPRTVLDVGCGYGKYGVLLREYLDPTPTVIGCEAWQPYVTPHRLAGVYDQLHVCDVLHLDQAVLDTCDLVLLGDVIEHIDKTAALDLLARCSGWVVVNTPAEHFDTGPGLPPTEAHVSHWTAADFAATGRLDRHELAYGALIVRLRPATPWG